LGLVVGLVVVALVADMMGGVLVVGVMVVLVSAVAVGDVVSVVDAGVVGCCCCWLMSLPPARLRSFL
jgi:hypothetical protein